MKSIYYISHATARLSQLDGIAAALEGGCRWIQLRMKNTDDDTYCRTARQARVLCERYGAHLILNDRIHLVRELGADGVHLGTKDMPIAEARRLLGPEAIVGATANTLERALEAARAGATYLGCGPYRFTTTKEQLAPLLGMEGYRRILHGLQQAGVEIPVVAIGGIQLADIPLLLATGVQGIALSGAMTQSEYPVQAMKALVAACEVEQY
jgi:thiamine-phosphate pyrophosphorylase